MNARISSFCEKIITMIIVIRYRQQAVRILLECILVTIMSGFYRGGSRGAAYGADPLGATGCQHINRLFLKKVNHIISKNACAQVCG